MSVLVLVLQVAVAQANAVPGQGSSGRTIPGGRTGTILVCYRLYAFVSFIHYCIAVLHHTSSSLATSPAGQYAMTAAESPARSLAATYSVNISASRLGSLNSFNSLPPQARSTALFGCIMFGPFRMCLTPVAQQQPVKERQPFASHPCQFSCKTQWAERALWILFCLSATSSAQRQAAQCVALQFC